MIITVAAFKGGVGKTTTAVHIAAYLQQKAPTLLIDGDPNRSATGWAKRGNGGRALPFRVIDERQAARFVPEFQHIVIDTQARPSREDLKALADGCDLLILPTTPDALSLDALLQTVDELQSLNADRYRILLTMIPPKPSRDGDDAHATLNSAGFPLFKTMIRRFVAFQKAALAGLPVNAVNDPRSEAAWEDYRSIGLEVTKAR